MVLRTLQELYYIPEPKNLHLLIMCINYNIYTVHFHYTVRLCVWLIIRIRAICSRAIISPL